VDSLGISPNTITLIGLLPALIAAWLIGTGALPLAGVVLILGAPLDALDGAVARAAGKVTPFGALLDSTVDRYADGLLFAAFTWYFAGRGETAGFLLTLIAWIGGFAVSYIRARAEAAGLGSIQGGLFDRLVRMLMLIGMLLSGWLLPGMLILAVGTQATALQRLLLAAKAGKLSL